MPFMMSGVPMPLSEGVELPAPLAAELFGRVGPTEAPVVPRPVGVVAVPWLLAPWPGCAGPGAIGVPPVDTEPVEGTPALGVPLGAMPELPEPVPVAAGGAATGGAATGTTTTALGHGEGHAAGQRQCGEHRERGGAR
ncbi:hypothetical protein CCR97_20515 [Rhodoplanes elegans]|nr:hypothetical protein [Rhodoplanes elegans]